LIFGLWLKDLAIQQLNTLRVLGFCHPARGNS
jgi:hypothetical protein